MPVIRIEFAVPNDNCRDCDKCVVGLDYCNVFFEPLERNCEVIKRCQECLEAEVKGE